MAKRSRKQSTNTAAPLFVGVLLLIGLFSFFTFDLNVLTILAFIIVFGLAIAIFLIARQRRLLQEKLIDDWFTKQGHQRDLTALPPREFELLISKLYANLGYQTELTPLSGDDGIDVKAMKDGKLTIIQAKQSKHPVGSPVIQTLYGSMAHVLADKAICVSTSGFTTEAARFAGSKNIELLDSQDLLKMIRSLPQTTE